MVSFCVNLAMPRDLGTQTNTNLGVPVEALFRSG